MGAPRARHGPRRRRFSVTPAGVELTSLHARLAGGAIDAIAHASFDGAGSTHLTSNDLDLPEFLRRVLADAPRVLPSARASGSLDAQWTRATLEGVQLTADSRLTAAHAGQRRSDPPVDAAMAVELVAGRGRSPPKGWTRLAATRRRRSAARSIRPNLLRSTNRGPPACGHDRRSRVGRMRWSARAGFLPVPPVRGAAAGDFLVGGTIGAPSLDGDVSATVRYKSIPAAAVRARASLTREAIVLDAIDARIASSARRGGRLVDDRLRRDRRRLERLAAAEGSPRFAPSIPRSLGSTGP